MDAPHLGDISPTHYSLWHIPSSSLLVLSAELRDVACRIRAALAHGCTLQDMLLEVTGEGDLIGVQHVGSDIATVLSMSGEEPLASSGRAGDDAVG
jgi:hypothetical protein